MVSHSFFETDTRIRQYTSALIERGDTIDVLALRDGNQPRFEVLDGVRVFRIMSRTVKEKRPVDYLLHILGFMFLATFWCSRRHLARPYDLVHVHSVPDFLVFSAILPKLLGARILLDIHDILPEFYASKFSLSPRSHLYRCLVFCERISASFSDHVIVANEIWRDRLLTRSVGAGKCTAIQNYPDPKLFRVQEREPGHGSFRVLYPGTLNRHQGLDIAIRAFAKVASRIPEAEFWIYGEGPEKPALEHLRDELGLTERVHLGPFLPLDQIVDIMAHADLAVVPKRVSTGFGNEAASTKIMEFMSLGVPVVVSRTQIDSLYYDDSLVRFVEPENEEALAAAIHDLWQNAELRKKLAINSLTYVKQHNWEDRKQDYFRVIDGAQEFVNYGIRGEADAKS